MAPTNRRRCWRLRRRRGCSHGVGRHGPRAEPSDPAVRRLSAAGRVLGAWAIFFPGCAHRTRRGRPPPCSEASRQPRPRSRRSPSTPPSPRGPSRRGTRRPRAAAAGFADAAARWHDFAAPYEEAHALLGQGRCLVALGRAPEAAPVLERRARSSRSSKRSRRSRRPRGGGGGGGRGGRGGGGGGGGGRGGGGVGGVGGGGGGVTRCSSRDAASPRRSPSASSSRRPRSLSSACVPPSSAPSSSSPSSDWADALRRHRAHPVAARGASADAGRGLRPARIADERGALLRGDLRAAACRDQRRSACPAGHGGALPCLGRRHLDEAQRRR